MKECNVDIIMLTRALKVLYTYLCLYECYGIFLVMIAFRAHVVGELLNGSSYLRKYMKAP